MTPAVAVCVPEDSSLFLPRIPPSGKRPGHISVNGEGFVEKHPWKISKCYCRRFVPVLRLIWNKRAIISFTNSETTKAGLEKGSACNTLAVYLQGAVFVKSQCSSAGMGRQGSWGSLAKQCSQSDQLRDQ